MTRARARLQFVVVLGVLAFAAGAWPVAQVVQQPPVPGVGPQAVTGTGFISGQVIEIPSGRPVSEARVTLLSRGIAQPGTRGGVVQSAVITDAQGRFFFARLPIGPQTLNVQKTGYESSRGSTTLDLTEGDRVADIKLRLSPVAAISGTVRDSAGDPVVGTTVFAFRRNVVSGRVGWLQAGRDVTDDRGEYRLSALPATDYLVCACTRDPIPFDGQLLKTIASEPLSLLSVASRALTVGADVVSLDNTLKTFAPRFHPNSASAARAARITVTPGEEKTGVDVSLDLVRATRVSGRVVGAQGPVQASSIRLLPAADAESGIDFTQLQPMVVQADGRFDFAPVPPGQYHVVVMHRDVTGAAGGPSGLAMGFVGSRAGAPPVPMRVGSTGPVDPLLWASEPLTVGDSGVSGFTVALNRSLSVRGRVQYVGAAPQPRAQQLPGMTVILEPTNLSRFPLFPMGTMSSDGTFVVSNIVPGRYRVSVSSFSGYPTLKSIVLGGQDITDMPLEVGEKDLAELVITFIDTPMAALTITAPVTQPQAADDLVALVFPADRKFWADLLSGSRRFRMQAMSAKGVVNLINLPAGDYFVALGSTVEIQNWPDPALLDAVSRRAQRITLSDGGKQTIEVRR